MKQERKTEKAMGRPLEGMEWRMGDGENKKSKE